MKSTKIRSMQSIILMVATLQTFSMHGMNRTLVKKAVDTASKALSPDLRAAYATFGLPAGAPYQEVLTRFNLLEDPSRAYNPKYMELKNKIGKDLSYFEYGQAFKMIEDSLPEVLAQKQEMYEAARQVRQAREAKEQAAIKAAQEAQEASKNAAQLSAKLDAQDIIVKDLKAGDILAFFDGLSLFGSRGGDIKKILDENHNIIVKNVLNSMRSVSGDIEARPEHLSSILKLSLDYHIFDSAADFAQELMKTPRITYPSEMVIGDEKHVSGLISFSAVLERLFNGKDIESLKDALIVYKELLDNKYITSSLINDPLKKKAEKALFEVFLQSLYIISNSGASYDLVVKQLKDSFDLLNEFISSKVVSSVNVKSFLSGTAKREVQKIINDSSGVLSLDQKEDIVKMLESKGIKLSFDAVAKKADMPAKIKLASDKRTVGILIKKGQLNKLEDVWNNSSSELKEYIRAEVLEEIVSSIGQNNLSFFKILKFGLTSRMVRMGQIISSKRFLDLVSKQMPEKVFGHLFGDCQSLQDYKIVTILLNTLFRDNLVSAAQIVKIKSDLNDSIIYKNSNFLIDSNAGTDFTSWIKDVNDQISWLSVQNLVDADRVKLALGGDIANFAKIQRFGRRFAMRILLAAAAVKWITERDFDALADSIKGSIAERL